MKKLVIKTALVLLLGLGIGYASGARYQQSLDEVRGIQAGAVHYNMVTDNWEWTNNHPEKPITD